MDVFDLFQRLGLALAIGFLIGVERGWHERSEAEGSRTAGLRTFALSGLLGGIAGLLGEALGDLALGLIFIGFAAAFAAYKWREARHENDYSVTVGGRRHAGVRARRLRHDRRHAGGGRRRRSRRRRYWFPKTCCTPGSTG